MNRIATLAIASAATLAFLTASPAFAERRVDAAARVKGLMGDLAKANGAKAERIEEEIAVLATDLIYMDDVEPVLITGLRSRSQRLRNVAARMLRYTMSGAAVQPLSKTMRKDRSAEVRLVAATSLCILKADGAVGALRASSTGDKSPKVRAAAGAALDVIEDRDGARRAGCRRSLQKAMASLL